MKPYRDMSDEEWQMVAPLLPELWPRSELRGRPHANTRAVLNGVLWVMYSGASWSTLPRKYPSYQTCHRRFKAWAASNGIPDPYPVRGCGRFPWLLLLCSCAHCHRTVPANQKD